MPTLRFAAVDVTHSPLIALMPAYNKEEVIALVCAMCAVRIVSPSWRACLVRRRLAGLYLGPGHVLSSHEYFDRLNAYLSTSVHTYLGRET
jgi:hypothetical protein